MDPDFSGSDPDFRLIRIRTQEKKFDPDPGKKTDSKDCLVERDRKFVYVLRLCKANSGEMAPNLTKAGSNSNKFVLQIFYSTVVV